MRRGGMSGRGMVRGRGSVIDGRLFNVGEEGEKLLLICG
jgi:hypothetical protein